MIEMCAQFGPDDPVVENLMHNVAEDSFWDAYEYIRIDEHLRAQSILRRLVKIATECTTSTTSQLLSFSSSLLQALSHHR